MPDPDVLKQSVTAGDYAETPQGGAIWFAVYSFPYQRALPPTLNGLSIRESDYVTISTLDHEALWAGAVATAITKVSCAGWEINGDVPLRNRRAQELLLGLDAGRGWVTGISKILLDFLLTSNGAFVEIVRATTSLNSQIIGLIPLDSLRCTRTGDPEKPVIYTDLKGRQHELATEEVIEFVDMPSPRATLFGSGRCAAARAFPAIYKLAGVETYISDKVTGRRPLAVHLVNGLNDLQLRSVLQTAQSDADARGALAYMGAIIATVPGAVTPDVATIPLADFPDAFNRRDELDIAVLSYASNLGLDVQDIQPLTGRALGTGAQSVTLDEKAKGKGLASFRQQFVHAVNLWVLPDLTTMAFIEKDWRDKVQQAEYNSKVEAYTADAAKNGIITPEQGLQALVDENVYDKAFLPVDQTPDKTLADTEKPETEQVEQPEAAAAAGQETPQISPDEEAMIEKQARRLVERLKAAEKEKQNHA